MRIWKYSMLAAGRAKLHMPAGAKILHARMFPHTGMTVFIWARVDPGAKLIERVFSVIGTGWELDPDIAWATYIDTVHSIDGLVWHLFDLGEYGDPDED